MTDGLARDRKQVRRLVLVETGPRSGEGMATLTPEAKAILGKTYAVPDELWLEVFFSPTEPSQAAGQAFLQRLRARKENRDREATPPVTKSQFGQVPDDRSLSVPELSATATADGFESYRDSDIFKQQTSHCRVAR